MYYREKKDIFDFAAKGETSACVWKVIKPMIKPTSPQVNVATNDENGNLVTSYVMKRRRWRQYYTEAFHGGKL